jgi:ribokinase
MVALFTVGGIIVDAVVTADGLVGPQTMGGNAVYSAAGARLWMDDVGIVGRIPANYPGDFLNRLEGAGIDLSGITTVDETVNEIEWFFYRADGSRADHLHAAFEDVSAPSPGMRLTHEERGMWESRLRGKRSGTDFGSFRRRNPVLVEDIPDHYRRARAVHLAANRPPHQIAIAERLKSVGLIVSVDPGSNAGELTRNGLEHLLQAASVFLPSEKELAVFVPGQAPADGLASLRGRSAGVLVVKLGSNGSLVLPLSEEPWAIPVVSTKALDPTGAGDAYCGGFLAGFCLSGDPVTAACLATISASFAVEDFGPFHLLGVSRKRAVERLHSLINALGPAVATRVLPHLSHMDLS